MSSAHDEIKKKFKEDHGRSATGLGIRDDLLSYHREDYDEVWSFIDSEMTVLGGRTPEKYDDQIKVHALDEELAFEKLDELLEKNEETASKHLSAYQSTHEAYSEFESILEENDAPTYSDGPEAKKEFAQEVYKRMFETATDELDTELEERPEIDVKPETDRTEFNYCDDSEKYFIALSESRPASKKPEEPADLFTGMPPAPELPLAAIHEAGHAVANILGDYKEDKRGEEYPVRSVKANNDINSEKAANEIAKFAVESTDFTLSDCGVPDEELMKAQDAYLEMTKWIPFDYEKQHPVEGSQDSIEEIMSKV